MVLFVLYVMAAVIAGFALRASRSLVPPAEDGEPSGLVGVRMCVAFVSLFLGTVGFVALSDVGQEPDDALYSKTLAYVILGCLPVGSALYVLGTIFWRGPRGFALRVAGWCAMALGLLPPSVLTLGLPMLAALAITLTRIPRRAAADPAPAGIRSG
jgi:hypothetical protein